MKSVIVDIVHMWGSAQSQHHDQLCEEAENSHTFPDVELNINQSPLNSRRVHRELPWAHLNNSGAGGKEFFFISHLASIRGEDLKVHFVNYGRNMKALESNVFL